MPVNATIPLTQDFLQTTGTYPLLTELIQHPTNGYLYGCYTEAGVGKILKLKNDDYTDVTVASLPVTAPIDMHYSATNDRFYVVYRTTNSPVTEVHPTTLAMVAFFSIASVGGQGAIAGDTSNLYVATFSTQKLYSISLATGLQVGLRTMPATGYAKINCLRYFSPKLYALSMDVDYVQLSRIVPATLGTEEVSAPIGIDAGEVPVDDMGESASHIYVGNRDLLGIIRKFSKTDFLNPELIETTQLSKCTCAKTVGGFVWAAFENGRGVRINPANIPDRRTYTLNDGEGYHSEFTGLGSEFVHTYNLSTSKIQRYRIPSDVVPGGLIWAKTIGGASSDVGNAVATDSQGNILVTGTIDGVPFVNKLSPDGDTLWSRPFGGIGSGAGNGVAVDSSDNVIVTGTFAGTINFGGMDKTAVGLKDVFLVKLDSAGTHQWSHRFGSTSENQGKSVAVDSSGNIMMIGYFQGDITFGSVTLTSLGGQDIFVARFLPDGTPVTTGWPKRFGGTGSADSGNAVAIDSAGNVIIAGSYSTSISFGGMALPPVGGYDMFLAKYSSAGVHQWSKNFGGTLSDKAKGMALDRSVTPNTILLTGTFMNTVDFGNGHSITATSFGYDEIFAAKFSSADGTCAWAKGFGGTFDDNGTAVAVDAAGNVAVTGYFVRSVNFGTGVINSKGGSDIYLVKYESDGTLIPSASRTIGGSSLDEGNGVAFDTAGNMIITGRYPGTVDFGGQTPPRPQDSITANGSFDIFVAKYASG